MHLLGIGIAFSLILFLSSKKINMGLTLIIATIITGLFAQISIVYIGKIIINALTEPLTLQLMLIVMIISGFGFLFKKTGDLEQMINALIALIKNGKILSMLLPALIGTIAVPGGAILSAPMLDKSGDCINLNHNEKTVINIFYRHIGFFIYPLHTCIIITSELFKIPTLTILKYNFLIMFFGFITAYFVYFRKNKVKAYSDSRININKKENKKIAKKSKNQHFITNLILFLKSFSPILLILFLALIIKVPFYLAVFPGLFLGLTSNLPSVNKYYILKKRIKDFFTKGVKYNLIGLIFGVMAFKNIIEITGSVNYFASFLTNTGIPLELMIVIVGLIPGYLLGINTASMAILIPVFLPLIPAVNPGPYISLLYTASFMGYILSPLHLCLVLTKEYFLSDFKYIYKGLAFPVLIMLLTALVQVYIY